MYKSINKNYNALFRGGAVFTPSLAAGRLEGKFACFTTVMILIINYSIISYKIRFTPGMSRIRNDTRNAPGIDRNDTITKRVKAPACTGSNAYWSVTITGTCRMYVPYVFSERTA